MAPSSATAMRLQRLQFAENSTPCVIVRWDLLCHYRRDQRKAPHLRRWRSEQQKGPRRARLPRWTRAL
eukprot:2596135-Alexandrium_andersonii.AAC.1